MAKMPGFFARNFTAAGKRRVQRMQVLSNRDASEQAMVFGINKTGRRAWGEAMGRNQRKMTREDHLNNLEAIGGQRQALQGEIAGLRQNMGGMQGNDLRRARLQLNDLTQQGRTLKAQEEAAMRGFAGRETQMRDLTGRERLQSAGVAAREYYFGGTGRQTAARIGATAGGIIGAGVLADISDGSWRD